jgi:hypothetical protein
MFIHTVAVGSSIGKHTVRRSKRGNSGREVFPATLSQKIYAEHFAAVDQNDRDSADYTTSMRTNRFYFRIKFWLLDRVVHVIYVIACWLARLARGPGSYRKYLKKDGRFKCQVDLGIEIFNYAIRKEWTDLNVPPPQWMRQTDWLPCECGKCFFCLNGLKNGIGH